MMHHALSDREWTVMGVFHHISSAHAPQNDLEKSGNDLSNLRELACKDCGRQN